MGFKHRLLFLDWCDLQYGSCYWSWTCQWVNIRWTDNSSSLFNLHYLESLNLAENSFYDTQIPSRFENLVNLIYLNLSNSDFVGQIPVGISSLIRLKILDLSLCFRSICSLKLENPNLMMLVHNLKTITELYLDGVNISAQGKEWCHALSSSLPNLRVFSMFECFLSGPIHSSLAMLRSLSVIHLDMNNLSTSVPEFLLISRTWVPCMSVLVICMQGFQRTFSR